MDSELALDIQAAHQIESFMLALSEMMRNHGIYFSAGMNREDRIMFHNGRTWASPESDLPNADRSAWQLPYEKEASQLLKEQ